MKTKENNQNNGIKILENTKNWKALTASIPEGEAYEARKNAERQFTSIALTEIVWGEREAKIFYDPENENDYRNKREIMFSLRRMIEETHVRALAHNFHYYRNLEETTREEAEKSCCSGEIERMMRAAYTSGRGFCHWTTYPDGALWMVTNGPINKVETL